MVSIITVNYNSRDLLRTCIESLERHLKVPYEIIVVDNGSADGSTKGLQDRAHVVLLPQDANLGFAKGCNKGARAAKGTILHFLNPDTEVDASLNAAYQTALDSAEACSFTTRLAGSTGQVERTSYVLPTFQDMFNQLVSPGKARRWHIGASIVVKPEVFWRVGGFSEEYFMYAEDLDLFYKFHLAGIPNRELPTVILHHKGGCSKNVWSTRKRFLKVEESSLIMASKFGIRLDYFFFKHIAFVRNLFRTPLNSAMELSAYWLALSRRIFFPGRRSA